MNNPELFALAVLALLATPGPTNTLLGTSGAASGFRRSLPLVPAELCGYLAAITFIAEVVGPVFWDRPWLSAMLRLGAAGYLTYLAIRLWRKGVNPGARRIVTAFDVFVTTLFNPKAAIFALIIIPTRSGNWALYMVGFSLLVVTMSILWISMGVILAKGSLGRTGYRFVSRLGAAIIALFAMVVIWPVIEVAAA